MIPSVITQAELDNLIRNQAENVKAVHPRLSTWRFDRARRLYRQGQLTRDDLISAAHDHYIATVAAPASANRS